MEDIYPSTTRRKGGTGFIYTRKGRVLFGEGRTKKIASSFQERHFLWKRPATVEKKGQAPSNGRRRIVLLRRGRKNSIFIASRGRRGLGRGGAYPPQGKSRIESEEKKDRSFYLPKREAAMPMLSGYREGREVVEKKSRCERICHLRLYRKIEEEGRSGERKGSFIEIASALLKKKEGSRS